MQRQQLVGGKRNRPGMKTDEYNIRIENYNEGSTRTSQIRQRQRLLEYFHTEELKISKTTIKSPSKSISANPPLLTSTNSSVFHSPRSTFRSSYLNVQLTSFILPHHMSEEIIGPICLSTLHDIINNFLCLHRYIDSLNVSSVMTCSPSSLLKQTEKNLVAVEMCRKTKNPTIQKIQTTVRTLSAEITWYKG